MPPRLHGLTLLRFAAALWVVFLHLHVRMSLPVPAWLGSLFSNGAHAMVLFFVLSGIVLTHGYPDLQSGPPTWRFYLARFARIYPAYLAVNLLALFWFTPASASWSHWLYANGLSVLTLQAWFPHAFGLGIIDGTWTISAEFFFYALFPLLLPLMTMLRTTVGHGRLCAGLVLLSGFASLADYVFAQQGTIMYYFLPVMRLPEFALGIVLGLALQEPGRPRLNPALNLLLAGAIALAVVCAPLVKLGGLWIRANILVIPLLAWLLYATVRAEQFFRPNWRSMPARLFIYLGESSYCLFLGHLVLLKALDSPAGTAWTGRLMRQGLAIELVVVFVVCALLLAILLHEAVEKPARRFLMRRWNAGRTAQA